MSPPPYGMGNGPRGSRRRGGPPPKPPDREALRRLWRHMRPFIRPRLRALGIGFFCLVAGLLLGKLMPLIGRHVLDNGLAPVALNPGDAALRATAWRLTLLGIGGMLLSSALQSALSGLHGWVVRGAGASMVRDLRRTVYDHLQSLALRFFDSRQTGDLLARVGHDVDGVETLITGVGDRLLTDVLNLLVTLGILFWLNPALALVALAPTPLLIWLMRRFSRRVRPVYREARDRFGLLQGRIQDNLSGIRVIKTFQTEDDERGRVGGLNDAHYDAQIEAVRLSSITFPLLGFLRGIGTVLVAGAGALMLLRPEPVITLGDLMAFIAFTGQLYNPLNGLFHIYNSVLRCLAAGERVIEVLETEPEIRDAPDAIALRATDGHIRFEQVAFAYTADTPVIEKISFEAPPGGIVALVGRSGAGKTSIVNLVARLYDPTGGRITLDGKDLRHLTQASLRRQIAIVPQDAFLFDGTLAENIRYARPAAGEAELRAAASAAQLDGFIASLPQGFETPIGERGVKLSGGQRQRVAIARALLADRRILILDEATSMVDTEAEQLIQNALAAVMRGRTTFVIAHRLSTVRHADQILVIENGRIAEQGRHDDLLDRNGLYAAWHRQASGGPAAA